MSLGPKPRKPKVVEAKGRQQAKGRVVVVPRRECEFCGEEISPIKKAGTRFCGSRCQETSWRQRQMSERILVKSSDEVLATPDRMGPVYKRMVESGYAQAIVDSEMTQATVATILGVTVASVSKALKAYRAQKALDEKAADWRPSWKAQLLFPTKTMGRARELGLTRDRSDDEQAEYDLLIVMLVATFNVVSRYYFILDGARPYVEPFHDEMAEAIIRNYCEAGKQLIVTAPRHGKSEMLIRFIVWMVVMNPNLRIMYLCANEDVAKIMVGAVKDHLTNNTRLLIDTLPPGETYEPDRSSGRPWSSTEIKVRQMNIVGQKSSTLLALGRQSKILSRDVDLMVTDDIEDFDSTREESSREYTRNKYAEYGTRKQLRTAWFNLCSRQHPDDLPNRLIATAARKGWKVLEQTAHDWDCDLDPEKIEGHDSNGCVLFPKVNPYEWLMEKKEEMDDLGLIGAFEMRYLQKPIAQEGAVFNMALIRERCLDRSRVVGISGMPAGRLIGGLDPAARGVQAAFCWNWTPQTTYMVDLDTQRAGGIAGALRQMELWFDQYDLDTWIYEENSQQIEFFRDPRFAALKARLGLTVLPHTTGVNKHDPELGISSMAPWFHKGVIQLPYGNAESRRKVNIYLRQLELWSAVGISKRGASDVKMAAWFPFPRMQRWKKGTKSQRIAVHEEGYGLDYATLDGLDSMNEGFV